ncbi:MAG: hypothetical protein APG12_00005 [Candidatus Methanofastidiosum methylothiophilum]|uniref:Uncharacterized protein n=1 Tax=Candidatus Methanofastidiosum methylothiophilum TaxID=1705564 RepID=A0A150J2Z6_9EURY|nr:MAG: hypothetical protein APG10_01394 [Candidatus Methanofastidiosum methylthiophilus]KYC48696.1 MAG: hypothetical protein APG11_00006 [Candidatus Methanofastidiosum methylthiophilus]KYC51344.1 MAG: hypothetical protein APG12_00005 [Candidatus Methanofastidiosum methylthiophilus]
MFVMLGSIFVFATGASTTMPTFEDLLSYQPPGGTSGCTNSRLLYEGSGTIPMLDGDASPQQFTESVHVIVNNNPAVHQWTIPYKPQCNYRVEGSGTTIGEGSGRVILLFGEQQGIVIGTVSGTESASFYWNPQNGIPTGVGISWIPKLIEGYPDGNPSLQYYFKIYEECPCSLPPLYPKVDIEQFTVTGGSTIIRDGKILSSFEISPGTQQTFIQVENRGFFTQNEAMIKFMGLPNGVTVNITPEAQKIKAHNLGTYSAIFTVDPNVPSGTYDVTIVAYSSTGTFDVIQFKFVVP